jgi:hypothetical protein
MRHMTAKAALAGALLVGLAATGCGGGPTAGVEIPPEHLGLQEVGEMYLMYLKEFKKAPKVRKDLDRYAGGFSIGSYGVQRGDLVVIWDAAPSGPSEAPGKVLAYEKKTPKEGGGVLMQDGTVKTMTPQEFADAPKAGTPSA